MRYLGFYDLVYESGWIHLVTVRVDKPHIVAENKYLPRHVMSLRRYKNPPEMVEK